MTHVNVNVLFDIPQHIFDSICINWLCIVELCKVESAVCCAEEDRKQVLTVLRNRTFSFHGIPPKYTRLDIFRYNHWLKLRSVCTVDSIDLRLAYKCLCRRIPSLTDVVGNAYSFSAESMKYIKQEMNIDKKGVVRFLDVGCGNAIFVTLLKICLVDVEVAGIDLHPVITTLQLIQAHCNCPEFQAMRLDAVDVLTPSFRQYAATFRPTHASCFSAVEAEETAFLAAMRDSSSVSCIAVTEKRTGAQSTDFAGYGFRRTARIVVQMAGIRKRRYVLFAQKIPKHT